MEDQMRAQGFDEMDAQRFGGLFGLATGLSESVPWFRMPIIAAAKKGVQAAGKMEAKELADIVTSPVEATLKAEVTDKKGFRKFVYNTWQKAMSPEFRGKAKDVFLSGVFEGLEEYPVESTLQGIVGMVHNGVSMSWAKNYKNMTEPWDIQDNPNGTPGKPYVIVDSENGSKKEISESEYAAIEMDKKRADDIISGKLYDDQWAGQDWRQSAIAALSTWATMGIMAGAGRLIQRNNVKDQQHKIAQLGLDIAAGTRTRQSVIEAMGVLDKEHGYWGNDNVDVNGNPLSGDTPSQREFWMNNVMEDIDHYTQVAKEFKITSPAVMAALQMGGSKLQNRDLYSEALVLASSIKLLNQKIAEVGENKPFTLTEEEMAKNDLYNLWDDTAKQAKQASLEELTTLRDKKLQELDLYIAPKGTVDEEKNRTPMKYVGIDGITHDAQYSQMFTNKYLEVSSVMSRIQNDVRRATLDKVGKKDDPKNAKMSQSAYDRKFNDEYNKQIDRLYQNSSKMVNSIIGSKFMSWRQYNSTTNPFSSSFINLRDRVEQAMADHINLRNAELDNYQAMSDDQWNHVSAEVAQRMNDIQSFFETHQMEDFKNFNPATIANSGIDKLMDEVGVLLGAMESEVSKNKDKFDQREAGMIATLSNMRKRIDASMKVAEVMDQRIADLENDPDANLSQEEEQAILDSRKKLERLRNGIPTDAELNFGTRKPMGRISVEQLTDNDKIEILKGMLNNIKSTDGVYTFKEVLDAFVNIANNPTGTIENFDLAQDVINYLSAFFSTTTDGGQNGDLQTWMNDNIDFMQGKVETSAETTEHSLLHNHNPARMNDNIRQALKDWYDKELKPNVIDAIQSKINRSMADRKVKQLRRMVSRVEVTHLFMDMLEVNFGTKMSPEAAKVLRDATDALDAILKEEVDGVTPKRLSDLLSKYIQLDDKNPATQAIRKSIEDKIVKYFSIQVQALDKMSGKLTQAEKDLVAFMGDGIFGMDSFERKIAFKDGKNEDPGLFSAESFTNGLSEFRKMQGLTPEQRSIAIFESEKQAELKFFMEYSMFLIHRINTAGTNGAPTFAELYALYRDVLNTNFKPDGTPVGDGMLGTFEQQDAIIHLLGWYFNPSQAWMKEQIKDTEPKTRGWDDTILLRAYNGTGKSTFVFRNFVHSLLLAKNVTDGKFKITVVTANSGLIKTFQDDQKILNQFFKGLEIQIIHADEVISGNTKADSDADFIWIEEASLFGREGEADKLDQNTRGKKRILVGDDGQTTSIIDSAAGGWFLQKVCEKTLPMTESFRSGIVSFSDTFAWARQQYFSVDGFKPIDWSSFPKGKWKHGQDGRGPIGLRVVTSQEQVLDDFLRFVGVTKGGDMFYPSEAGRAILIVSTALEKQWLLHTRPELRNFANQIKTIQYDLPYIIAKGTREDNISGIEADYVFIYDNFKESGIVGKKIVQDFAAQTGTSLTDPYEGGSDLGKRQARHVLTATSRVKRFLVIINPEVNSSTEPIETALEDEKIEGWVPGGGTVVPAREQVLLAQRLLEQATQGKARTTGTGGTSITRDDLIFDANMTEDSKKEVLKFKEVEDFKAKFQDNFSMGNVHVTDHPDVVAMLAGNPNADPNVMEVNSLGHQIHREILMQLIDPNRADQPIFTLMDKFLRAYMKVDKVDYTESEIPDMVEPLVIKWKKQMYLSPSLTSLVGDPLTVAGKYLSYNGVSGSPAIVTVVGFDKASGKPIVNITNFTWAKVDQASDYSKAVLGTYAALAQANGAIVNRISVVPVKLTYQNKHFVTNFGDAITLPMDERLKWVEFGRKAVKATDPIDGYFATLEQMKAQGRVLPYDYEGIRVGSWYFNRKTGKVEKVTGIETNNKGEAIIYTLPDKGTQTAVPFAEFNRNFVFSSDRYLTPMFKTSAVTFFDPSQEKVLGTSHIFAMAEILDTDYIKGKNFYHTGILALRNLVRESARKRGSLTKVLYVNDGNNPGGFLAINEFGNKVDQFNNWKYIVTNELDESQSRSILKTNKELIANIDAIPLESVGIKGVAFKTKEDERLVKFRRLGLHILSADYDVDIDYTDETGINGIKLFDNPASKGYQLADKYITTGDEEIFDWMRKEGFKQTFLPEDVRMPDSARMANIEMNIYRLKVMRLLQQGVVLKQGFTIGERNKIFTSQVRDMPTFVEHMERKGYTFLRNGNEVLITRPNIGDVEFYITAITPEGTQMNIYFNGARLGADIHPFVNSLLSELSPPQVQPGQPTAFDTLDDLAQKLSEANAIADKTARDVARDVALKNIREAFYNIGIVQFFNHNSNTILKRMKDDKTLQKFVEQFLVVSKDHRGNEKLVPKGYTYAYQLSMLQGFFTQLLKANVANDGMIRMTGASTGFYLHKSMYDSGRNTINGANMVTNVEDIGEPMIQTDRVAQITVAHPGNPVFMRRGLSQFDDVRLASIHTVRDEISRILGERFTENERLYLRNENEMSNLFSENLWGAMKSAAIYLTTLGNGEFVNYFSGRHEAWHFVLRTLLTEEAEEKILNAARQRMVKDGLAKTEAEISYVDAHEFSANMFMRKEYKKNNLIGRIMDAVRAALERIGIYSSSIDFYMRRVDSGRYANAPVIRNSTDDITFYMHANWKYGNEQAIDLLTHTFGEVHGWTSVIENRVAPVMMGFSPFSKSLRFAGNEGTKKMINNTIAAFEGFNPDKTDEFAGDTVTISRIVDTSDSRQEVEYKSGIPVSEMTGDDYLVAISHNTYGNRTAAYKYENYHLSRQSILLPMIQYIFKTVDVEKIMDGFKLPKVYGRSAWSQDSDTIMPEDSMSQLMKMIFNNMPYWNYSKGKIERHRNKVPYRVNAMVLDHILTEATRQMYEAGVVMNDQNWLNKIESIMKEYAGTKENEIVNTVYSFLMEWGRNPKKTRQMYDPESGEFIEKIGGDSVVGRWEMVTDMELMYADGTPEDDGSRHRTDFEQDYYQKIEAFRDSFSAIKTYYMSRAQRKQAEFKTYYMNKKIWFEFYARTNNDMRIFLSDIRSIVRSNVYDGATVQDPIMYVNSMIQSQVLPGKEQIYEYDPNKNQLLRRSGNDTWIPVLGQNDAGNWIGSSTAMSRLLQFVGADGFTEDVIQEHKEDKRNNTQRDLLTVFKIVKLGALLSKYRALGEENKLGSDMNIGFMEYLRKINTPESNLTIQLINMVYTELTDGKHDLININDIMSASLKEFIFDRELPQVMDMWKFFETLSIPYQYKKAVMTNRITRGVSGTPKSENPLGSLILQAFPGKTSTRSRLVKQITQAIDAATVSSSGGNVQSSPIFSFSNGERHLNNPVLNGKVSWDDMFVVDGVLGFQTANEYTDMSIKDKLRGMLEGVIWASQVVETKGSPGLGAFIDTLSDKKAKYLSVLNYNSSQDAKGSFFNVVRDEKFRKVRETRVNAAVIGSILRDFIRYYRELRRVTEAKFNEAQRTGNFFNLDLNRDYIIDKNGEYLPGNAITQPGNPYNDIDINPDTATDLEIYNAAKKAHQKYYDDLVSIMNENAYRMPDHIASQFGAWKVDGKSMAEWREEAVNETSDQANPDGSILSVSDEDKKAVWAAYDEKRDKAIEEMKNAGYKIEDSTGNQVWHPIVEAAYWGHHIYNESISHLVRGSQFEYESVIDFIKRGSGITIEGLNYNVSNETGLRETDRILIVDDIQGDDPYFGKTKKMLDGSVFLNPFRAYEYEKAQGGIIGPLGDGPQKNVLFDYDPVTMNRIYAKMDHFPISAFDYYNSPVYRQMVHLMLGPIITKYLTSYQKHLSDKPPTALEREYMLSELQEVIDKGFDEDGNPVKVIDGIPKAITNRLLYNFDGAIRDIYRRLQEPTWTIDGVEYDTEELRKTMIGWVAFKSAIKAGITRVNDLFTPDETGRSLMDKAVAGEVDLNKELNRDDRVVVINNRNLRLQTVTAQGIESTNKNYPTQIANIIGILDQNTEYARKIQDAIAGFVNEASEQLNNMSESEVRNMLAKRGRNFLFERGDGSIISNLLSDPNIVPEVVRAKQAMEIINFFNDFIKPDLPGNTYIQEPSLHELFVTEDSSGKSHVRGWKDLTTEQQIQVQKGDGAIGRHKLRSAQYVVDGTDINPDTKKRWTKDEIREILSKNPDRVKYRPADIIIAFPHAKEFGLSYRDTLADITTYKIEGMNYSLYEQWDDRWTIERYREFFSKLVQGKDTEIVLKGFQMNVEKAITREAGKTATAAGRSIILSDIVDAAAEYFYNLNLAFDVFFTRIPTSNASSGAVARITAFTWDKQNAAVLNPFKNQFDGSDFDSDPLQVYFRTFDRSGKLKTSEKLDQFRNDMFGAFYSYYMDTPQNFEMVTTPIDLQGLRDIRDTKQRSHLMMASTLGTMLEMDYVNHMSKSMVGFMANIENFIGKMLHLPFDERKRLFDSGMLSGELRLLVNKDQQQYIPRAIEFIANLINAATDSAKEGGLLGDLNLDFHITSIVVGMIVSGTRDGNFTKEVFDTIVSKNEKTASIIKQVITRQKKSQSVDQRRYNVMAVLTAIENEYKSAKDVEGAGIAHQLLQFAFIGQAVRNLGSVAKLQSKELNVKVADFYMNKMELEYAIGGDLDEFIRLSADYNSPEFAARYSVERQVNYVDNEGSYYFTKNKGGRSFEGIIRSMINVPAVVARQPNLRAMVIAANSAYKAMGKVFVNEKFTRNGKPIVMNTMLQKMGQNQFMNPEQFEAYEFAMRQSFIGMFLSSEFKEVTQTYSDESGLSSVARYDMSDNYSRYWFVVRFPEYLSRLKEQYPRNLFIERLESMYDKDQGLARVNFKNSIYITDEQKAMYHRSFMELPETVRRNLYAYQLLTNGFEVRNGSMFEIMDKEIGTQYSQWQERTITNDRLIFDADKLAEDIIVKRHDVFIKKVTNEKNDWRPPYYKESLSRIFNQRLYKVVDGKRIPINSVYPEWLNTYGARQSNMTTNKTFKYVKPSEMKDLRRNGVKNIMRPKISLVGKEMTEVQEHNDHYVYAGDTNIMLPDGSVASVRMKVSLKDGKEITRRNHITLDLSNSNIMSASFGIGSVRNASRVAELFVTRLQRMLPNVVVRMATSIETEGDLARFTSDGTLLINEQMLSPEVAIHELAHPFLYALKYSNPELFNNLVKEALDLMNQNPVFAQAMQSHYGHQRQDIFEMEVVANLVGKNTFEKMQAWLTFHGVENSGNRLGFWQKVHMQLEEFWQFVRSLIGRAFGIDRKFTGTTVKDLSNFLYNAWVAGDMVTPITSRELAIMSEGSILSARFQQSSLKTSADILGQVRNSRERAAMTDEQKIAWASKWIRNNNMETPPWFSPNTPRFTELESQAVRERLLKMYNEFIDRRNNYASQFVRWLSETGGQTSNSKPYFGEKDNGEPLLSVTVLSTFLRQIDFDGETKYYLYKDLWKTEHKDMHHTDLDMDNVIVGVKVVDGRRVVSLYDVSRNPIIGHDPDTIEGGFLDGVMSSGRAAVLGVDYDNSNVDISAVGLGLIHRYLVKNLKDVDVDNIAYIDVFNGVNNTYIIDPVRNRRNIESMARIPEFMNSVADGLVKEIFGYNGLRDANPDYEKLLISFYLYNKTPDLWKSGPDMNRYVNDPSSLLVEEKIAVLNYRLRVLLGTRTEQGLQYFQGDELREVGLLIHAIQDLHYIGWMSGQMNRYNGPNTMEKMISDGSSVGNDYIQFARSVALDTSRRIVFQINNIKKTMNPAFEHFRKQYAGGKEYFSDASKTMFDRIFASVKTDQGDRPIGFLLWTKDEREDPMFAKQAIERGLTEEDLKYARTIVELIHEQMVENYYHARIMAGYNYKPGGGGVLYTLEDAAKDIMQHTTYRKGMIPVMKLTAREMLTQAIGNMSMQDARNALVARTMEIGNIFELFQNMDASEQISDEPNTLKNMFWWQFGYNAIASMRSEFGYERRLKEMLGLQLEFDPHGKEIWTVIKNPDGTATTDSVSRDLELITNYFLLTSKRSIGYENDVLPVLTGIKVFMHDMNSNAKLAQEFKVNEIIDYVNLFTDVAIKSKRRIITGPGDINLDKTLNLAHSVIGPYFLTLNVSVGMVSALSNMMFAHIEGLSRTLVDAVRKEGIQFYGEGNLIEASVLFAKDFNLIGQILQEYQIMDMSEMSQAHSRIRNVTKKQVFSNFWGNWFNWSADFYARAVVAVAQMLHDGSYGAHYLKEDGALGYDPKKDRRFWNADGTQTPEQKVLYENMKDRQRVEGIIKKDEDLTYAYDFRTMGTLKFLSDKYVVGSFDNMVRAMIGAGTLGKAFSIFKTWFFARVTNAFQDGYYLDSGGFYVVEKDADGNMAAKWQRIWVEGYIRTFLKFQRAVLHGRGITYLKNMNVQQQENLTKLGLNLMLSIGGLILYYSIVQSYNAPEEEKKKKPIPPYRLVRNFKYSLESLLVIPTMFEMLQEPFVSMNILKNIFMDPFGNWRFAAGTISMPAQYTAVMEAIEGMEEKERKAREKAEETKRQKEQEKAEQQ